MGTEYIMMFGLRDEKRKDIVITLEIILRSNVKIV